ncbi:MAG: SurA N-terminal domain-containing protein [Fimbriimonadaceae bacterium]|nr:SurA N-terminal domain-containing protein [Chthonomonadaceae bacterium]MCO5298251.1 SurA N-terminal domain-containing protein [Fimbriimonadaceae bacterium]
MKKTILFGIAASLAALFVAGCGRGGGGELAVVNGEKISAEDFHKYLETKNTVTVVTPTGAVEAQVAGSLAFQALKDLVARKVLIQLAKDEGVAPTEQDVLAELEFQKKLNPNFIKERTADGTSIQDLKEGILVSLAREKLLSKGITITKDEVDKYIANNKQMFMDPALADMQWIFVKTDAAKAAVDKELATGQPFLSVAQRLSEIPNARQDQARFPERRIGQLPPELQTLVNKTDELKVSDWLKLTDGWAKFYIQKKTPAKPINMDEPRKELVRRQLAQQRGSQAVDLNKRMSDKIKSSEIKVDDPTLKAPWDKAMEELKKASAADVPKGAEAPAPAAAGG